MAFIEYRGEVRELTPGETVVGSGSQAGWRLQQADLAARHFAVATGTDGVARVRCLAGQHIVAVNGHSVGGEPVGLRPGDVIAAGTARFLYLDRADAPRPAGWENDAGEVAWLVNDREREGYALDRRAMTIGRDAASNIHLQDPSVSRFHADVRREAGLFVLYAMGSAGTKINGQRVAGPVVLEQGDRIEIGDSVLQFTREKPDVSLVRGGDTQENRISRRQTVLQQRAVETGEFGRTDSGRGRMLGIGIGVAVVVIALLAWLLTR